MTKKLSINNAYKDFSIKQVSNFRVFYIDGAIIVTEQDAKEYYIDYMDKKKEKLAMAVYNNNIVNKLKKVWNIFKSKFTKISFGK